jgi:hypothetical protein
MDKFNIDKSNIDEQIIRWPHDVRTAEIITSGEVNEFEGGMEKG